MPEEAKAEQQLHGYAGTAVHTMTCVSFAGITGDGKNYAGMLVCQWSGSADSFAH